MPAINDNSIGTELSTGADGNLFSAFNGRWFLDGKRSGVSTVNQRVEITHLSREPGVEIVALHRLPRQRRFLPSLLLRHGQPSVQPLGCLDDIRRGQGNCSPRQFLE